MITWQRRFARRFDKLEPFLYIIVNGLTETVRLPLPNLRHFLHGSPSDLTAGSINSCATAIIYTKDAHSDREE